MTAVAPRLRRPLGRCLTLHERMRVYLTEGALEIDLIDAYEVQRQRVFFEDVRLITLHFSRSRPTLWLTGLATAAFSFPSVMLATEAPGAGLVFFLFACLPFLIPFVLACARPAAQVTVYGKRSKAVMRWWFLHESARAIHAELCDLTKAHQEEARLRADERRAQAVSPFAAAPAAAAAPTAEAPPSAAGSTALPPA